MAATDEVAKQRCAARRHRASATAVGDRDRHRATAGGDGGLLMGHGGRTGKGRRHRIVEWDALRIYAKYSREPLIFSNQALPGFRVK